MAFGARGHGKWKSFAGGAIGGLAASYAMSQFHSLWNAAAKKRSGESGEDATVKTASAISENVFQHELTKPEKQWAGPVVHYAFGAVCGALYGALAEAAPFSRAGFGVFRRHLPYRCATAKRFGRGHGSWSAGRSERPR